MKQTLLSFLFFSAFSVLLQAQITVGTEIFPVVDDVLTIATDAQADVAITAAGEDQVWDWSALEADTETEKSFQAATEGGFNVAGANMVVVGALGGGETYYKSTANSIETVALFGEAPIDLGTNLLSTYNPALKDYRAPLNYNDEFVTESTLTFPAFDAAIIPGGILDSLELPVTPDSVRFGVALSRTSTVDAWGTMTIPSGTYDVLRERRVETRSTTIGFKVSIFPWVDVPVPAEFGANFTNVTYVYWSNTSKEPIALVTTTGEEETVQSVEYKNNENMVEPNAVNDISLSKSSIYAYPNPAYSDVNFAVENLEAGVYTVKIYNILGSEVWQNNYFISGNDRLAANLSQLHRGTYLYSLANDKGDVIATHRLILARP